MAQDLILAAGARLDALLKSQEARSKASITKVPTNTNPSVPFTMLPNGTKQFAYASLDSTEINTASNTTPSVPADLGVGATFRRKGVASDVPMTVTRVGDGMVFSSFTDSEGTQELSFATNQVEVVSTAAQSSAFAELPFYQSAPITIDSAPSFIADRLPHIPAMPEEERASDAPVQSTLPPSAAHIPRYSPETNDAATIAYTANSTPVAEPKAENVTPTVSAPTSGPGWILLANGTKQFGYAPTGTNNDGSVINAVKNTTPAVSADFGVGATFRFHGLHSQAPMTVTRVGNGVVFAMYTDSEGTREMPFTPNQLDLVTAAPQ